MLDVCESSFRQGNYDLEWIHREKYRGQVAIRGVHVQVGWLLRVGASCHGYGTAKGANTRGVPAYQVLPKNIEGDEHSLVMALNIMNACYVHLCSLNYITILG